LVKKPEEHVSMLNSKRMEYTSIDTQMFVLL
jgi:hypothetical protein